MAGGASPYEDEDGGGGMIADINVTPLVDITLVLLIIFMVTARIIVSRAIPGVESPKAVSGEEVKTTLALTLDRERTLYLNGDKVDDRKVVADYIKNAATQNPDIQAVITADTVVPHGDVIGLIDLVKLAGVKRFALTVEKKAEAP
jgi:biopolymer transport protein ExbD